MVRPTLQEYLETHTMTAAPALARTEEGGVRCLACGNRCLIPAEATGVCRLRLNRGGVLRAPCGYVAGMAVDPVEKKPFFHVLPGAEALSFGMLGCNLHCSFCQNWLSSQALREDYAVGEPRECQPEELAGAAVRRNVPLIVSTYNEPLVTADWAAQIFEAAHDQGLRCGFVSNGYATLEVLEFLRPHLDIYKVDLKCFTEESYRELGGKLDVVCDTIRRCWDLGYWVEVVTLVVPGFNDRPEELEAMAGFVAEVSPDIPWHVTAFHPDYKMTQTNRTAVEDLERAYRLGKDAGLHYVYAGNLHGGLDDSENTRCPGCGALLIKRRGFAVLENNLREGACFKCGTAIAGIWR